MSATSGGTTSRTRAVLAFGTRDSSAHDRFWALCVVVVATERSWKTTKPAGANPNLVQEDWRFVDGTVVHHHPSLTREQSRRLFSERSAGSHALLR
jgi:hypothetical protein